MGFYFMTWKDQYLTATFTAWLDFRRFPKSDIFREQRLVIEPSFLPIIIFSEHWTRLSFYSSFSIIKSCNKSLNSQACSGP